MSNWLWVIITHSAKTLGRIDLLFCTVLCTTSFPALKHPKRNSEILKLKKI